MCGNIIFSAQTSPLGTCIVHHVLFVCAQAPLACLMVQLVGQGAGSTCLTEEEVQ